MPPYRQLGSIPPQAPHRATPRSPAIKNEGIYYEEVVTTAGFGRAYSICYHLRPPTRVAQGRGRRRSAAGHRRRNRPCGIIISRAGI